MWKKSCSLILFVGVLWGQSLAGAAGRSETSDPPITHAARSLQPGEVILLTLRSERDLSEAKLQAFSRKFPIFRGDNGEEWHSLVGIDLKTKPGTYTLTVADTETAAGDLLLEHRLRVRDKSFPTRRLTVDEKFVTPPQEVLERIRRESRRVSGIFATISPERYWKGTFQRPVPGRANSSFGKRSILNGKPRSPHTGTDFTADAGTPVAAPNVGRVVLADDLYYSGNTVILDHGLGLYSYFAHLSEFLVWEGDMVTAGTIVGRVGATGRVTGPHLHWTMKLAGVSVDPLSLMAVLEQSSARQGVARAESPLPPRRFSKFPSLGGH